MVCAPIVVVSAFLIPKQEPKEVRGGGAKWKNLDLIGVSILTGKHRTSGLLHKYTSIVFPSQPPLSCSFSLSPPPRHPAGAQLASLRRLSSLCSWSPVSSTTRLVYRMIAQPSRPGRGSSRTSPPSLGPHSSPTSGSLPYSRSSRRSGKASGAGAPSRQQFTCKLINYIIL